MQAANIDESIGEGESAEALVLRLARQKAQCVFNEHIEATVIGSDTVIACDTEILGKPASQAHFMQMMKRLSNRKHLVHTAVACINKHMALDKLVSTEITFADITEAQAMRYWQSGEPKDKAGGYAIQGLAEQFIVHINGSYSAVVGLPLYETKQMLEKLC